MYGLVSAGFIVACAFATIAPSTASAAPGARSAKSKRVRAYPRDTAWTVVKPGLRARVFSVRGRYCPGEPIDLVMLVHNTSRKRMKLRPVRPAPVVGQSWRPRKNHSLTLRWRYKRRGLKRAQDKRKHLKTLAYLPRKLNPGEMHVVAVRLMPGSYPMRKLYMRHKGEPVRVRAEFDGRPRGDIVIEARWAPLLKDKPVDLVSIPVHIRSSRHRHFPADCERKRVIR